jgi:hypothetical protein
MSNGLVRLFAVAATVIGSLALSGMALADCTPSHKTTASTSIPATPASTTSGTATGG